VRRGNVAGLLVLTALVGSYAIALYSQIHRVNQFCAAMRPGLDVHQIADIAKKYDVGFANIRNPNSVELRSLGIKDKKKDNTWFFGVAAPMTMGDHACGVYHDYHVVISSRLSPD
jgi:hypothetical protein